MINERFQSAVQQALADSAAARAACAQLTGKSLAIVARHTPFAARIRSDGNMLAVEVTTNSATTLSADATLTGSPPGLLALLRADQRELVQRGLVDISGDTDIAERFARLFRLLRPDLETVLGGAIGRAPAHLFATGIERLQRHGSELLAGFSASAADYLAHERRALLTSAEAQVFYRQVDELQTRVTQLEAQVRARGAAAGITR
jgi:ubiquinone biosynthesis protein UbiJ